uniref:NADH-ubiquinone oxidoreductase chain 2 n=1 Tax=Marisa cornuarietis TaxID=75126 RepID=A0A0U1XFD9_MARCO|nr:NADH dehydrogenase subunit 2 [Marisa cornuarietis]AIT57583.1 NADH dehydrogenase subunit 2 [Marisa cornuarietis]
MLSVLPFKFLFIMVLIFGTLFSLSSVHWLGVWAGLEINLIGFIPLLVYQKKAIESESAVKYFVAQAVGSSLLIFGSLTGFSLSWNFMIGMSEEVKISLFLVTVALILKMGAFPMHYWFPSVMASLSWVSCLILVTWQKVAPVFLMSSFFEVSYMFWFGFVLCLFGGGSSLVGGIGGVSQTQIRALLAYSSIGHLGWIMFSVVFSEWAFKVYFSVYIMISVAIFLGLWFMNMNNMLNTSSFNQKSSLSILVILVLLMSLGGLPPLLGFISKMIVIMSCIMYTSFFILSFLIIGSLVSLFYYLSLFFSLYIDVKPFGVSSFYSSSLSLDLITNVIIAINFLGILGVIWSLSIELF